MQLRCNEESTWQSPSESRGPRGIGAESLSIGPQDQEHP